MILEVASNKCEVHLAGGGYKDGYIPVFISPTMVNSKRDNTSIPYSFANIIQDVASWYWSVVYGVPYSHTTNLLMSKANMYASDRTRENAMAEPHYAGIEVKNSTKYSSSDSISNNIDISCMQGEYIEILIPESFGNIIIVPVLMFGLIVSKCAKKLVGPVGFLGSKSFIIGTDRGMSITITVKSSIMKRLY